jgi:hypothetical protein
MLDLQRAIQIRNQKPKIKNLAPSPVNSFPKSPQPKILIQLHIQPQLIISCIVLIMCAGIADIQFIEQYSNTD